MRIVVYTNFYKNFKVKKQRSIVKNINEILSVLGRHVVDDSQSSQSDEETASNKNVDDETGSMISDELEWSVLDENVRDILRMKKRQDKYSDKQMRNRDSVGQKS